jgi:hypothetical protein
MMAQCAQPSGTEPLASGSSRQIRRAGVPCPTGLVAAVFVLQSLVARPSAPTTPCATGAQVHVMRMRYRTPGYFPRKSMR